MYHSMKIMFQEKRQHATTNNLTIEMISTVNYPRCNTIIVLLVIGLMVSVLTTSVVDCRFEPRSGQTKDYNVYIWYLLLLC
jgi:hypothetical protein